MQASPRIVVLISGSGTNLQALIDRCADGQIDGEIVGVLSNRPGVYGLERAANAEIPTQVLDHKAYDSRDTFDRAMIEAIDAYEPDLLVLAGFMRILTPEFVNHYAGRMLNIHPSLLPKYRGLHTHQRALDAGDSEHGVTVHFVTAELDGGPLILQAAVPVEEGDTAESLAKKVQVQEHIIYPIAVHWFCQGRLVLQDGQVLLDGQALPATGQRLNPAE